MAERDQMGLGELHAGARELAGAAELLGAYFARDIGPLDVQAGIVELVDDVSRLVHATNELDNTLRLVLDQNSRLAFLLESARRRATPAVPVQSCGTEGA